MENLPLAPELTVDPKVLYALSHQGVGAPLDDVAAKKVRE
jgi:hypothetical protein